MNDDRKRSRAGAIVSKAYFKQGLAVFLIGSALIITYYYVNHFSVLKGGISRINDILAPFYLGIIIAYLLCPIFNLVVRRIYPLIKNKFKTPRKAFGFSKFIATLVSLIVLFVVITGLILMIIPSLYESIVGLVPKLPRYIDSSIAAIESHLSEDNDVARYITDNLDALSTRFTQWMQEKVLPASEVLFTTVTTGIRTTISAVLDFVIAVIISVYILNSKELFIAQGKKLIRSIFNERHAEALFELGILTNNTFGGFINGKIIDSFIMGVLCFIIMSILGMPMEVLISVIIGVTNIIPFFGPFIGAIPSAFLLLLIDPISCIKFLIMILILQQVDGNIIGPKILGKATKLSSFWVMFAILVGGGLFGFAGMVVGVPFFAVIYTYVARGINNSLRRKDIETDTLAYEDFSKYGTTKTELFGREGGYNGSGELTENDPGTEDN